MLVEEFEIELPLLRLAACSWGPRDAYPILALHGWLDNAASFDLLVEALLPQCPQFRFIAIDLPGHGKSDWFKDSGTSSLLHGANIVLDTIKALDLKEFILLGHSMGGAISAFCAGGFPEWISHLILLEGMPSYAPSSDDKLENTLMVYRYYYKSLEKQEKIGQKTKKIYPNLQALIRAKKIANQFSEKSATLITKRNVQQTNQGYLWRTDPSLHLPPLHPIAYRQAIHFLQAIQAETLVLMAKDSHISTYRRASWLAQIKCIPRAEVHWDLDGGHHCHLENPKLVADRMATWLNTILPT